ncbi:MAG TPA: protein kinase, partial [Ktedonobacteraceae bacterium]
FNREASVLSSLQHPQVPQIYDQFSDPDHWYLVLQYVEGPTLETYLEMRATQGKPLQFDEVLEIALQLGEVLHYLHTRQPPVIFRDLKPSNIIRTPPKGTLCLVDFGIARRFRPGQQRDTQALGSPGYAAPEQYGRAQTTPRSDIYSLGALLHFLLSGDDPAEEASPGLRPLSLHAEKGAEALSELVQCMLSPDPELRPATMSKVITALEAIQQQHAAQPAARIWQPPVPRVLPFLASSRQVRVPASSLVAAGQGSVAQRKRLHLHFFTRIINKLFTRQPSFQRLSDTAYAYLRHTSFVNAVAWSPNGKDIASGSSDSSVQVWDAL